MTMSDTRDIQNTVQIVPVFGHKLLASGSRVKTTTIINSVYDVQIKKLAIFHNVTV